jgi:hypothetical protein
MPATPRLTVGEGGPVRNANRALARAAGIQQLRDLARTTWISNGICHARPGGTERDTPRLAVPRRRAGCGSPQHHEVSSRRSENGARIELHLLAGLREASFDWRAPARQVIFVIPTRGDAMATKAEWFRYRAERSGPKRPKRAPRAPRNVGVDTAAPGVSATDRKALLPRKASPRAGKRAVYALERSERRPSRRSTRKAANRQKTDVKMRRQRRLPPR